MSVTQTFYDDLAPSYDKLFLDWEGEHYRLVQYIIEDGETLCVSKFSCEYRATRREELTKLLKESGCREVKWIFPKRAVFISPSSLRKNEKQKAGLY